MKRIVLLLLNIIIVVVTAVGVWRYAYNQECSSQRIVEENFLNTTEVISGVADNYLSDSKTICEAWAAYLTSNTMTMESALDYLSSAKVVDSASAHIIWADSLQGWSIEGKLSDPSDYTVDYTLRASIFSDWSDRDSVFITSRYTSPTTGAYVIAFCRQVVLLDEKGLKRDAIIMRVVPNNYLATRWVFPSNYKNAVIAIVDNAGGYVIKPAAMKNENFFSYMYSFNQGVINQDQLKERFLTEDVGSFDAKNASRVESKWSFRRLKENSQWIVVVSVPKSEVSGVSVDWIVAGSIMGALLVILLFDVLYYTHQNRKESANAATLKENGEQLQIALEAADQANRAKTVFLSNMSHDIRTPMNAIVGFTSLARSHIDQRDKVEEYLGKILTSSEHLLSLINDVLDMSRIESGKVNIEEHETYLPDMIRDLSNILQSEMKSHNITYDMKMVNVSHENIICDKLRLNQVLINLLSNAMKYTEAGGRVELIVEEKNTASDGYADFEFRINDTGKGMDEETVAQLFDPYLLENVKPSGNSKNYHLGMVITKSIVDMMFGTIHVESKVNEGTNVVVSLCFRTVEHYGMEKKDPLSSSMIPKNLFSGKRILLIDDVEINRELAMAILCEIGFDVEMGENGQVAVDMVANSKPGYYDLVLMDIMMPVMDGYEATRTIRRLDNPELANIPIVAMTANAFEEDRVAAFEAGMNEHITKPFQVLRLYEAISKFI